jgi:translation initiation factor eIF-2B subunit epsilon
LYAIAQSSRLLHFEMTPRYPRRKRARLPREAFETAQDFALRHDLGSIGVDICSTDVPALFTENFDYQTLQPHFVNGILTSDLLGKTISCSVVGETPMSGLSKRTPQWATLITTPRSYAAARLAHSWRPWPRYVKVDALAVMLCSLGSSTLSRRTRIWRARWIATKRDRVGCI